MKNDKKSRPAWARGLKQYSHQPPWLWPIVAPRVGAWIETLTSGDKNAQLMSRPAWARGLKHVNRF